MDEFWIEPIAIGQGKATVHVCFNEFSLIIVVERKDGQPITENDANKTYTSVVEEIYRRDHFR